MNHDPRFSLGCFEGVRNAVLDVPNLGDGRNSKRIEDKAVLSDFGVIQDLFPRHFFYCFIFLHSNYIDHGNPFPRHIFPFSLRRVIQHDTAPTPPHLRFNIALEYPHGGAFTSS